MKTVLRLLLIVFLAFFNGCASSFVKIEDPNMSLEGENFIIQPPENGEWYYRKGDRDGKPAFLFGKKSESETLSTYAIVAEKRGQIDFSDDIEFLNFVKNTVKFSNNPDRMELLESNFELKELFGAKTVSYFCFYKDYEANNIKSNDFLLLKVAGNIIIHPQKNNILIQMDYSERGLPSEMDINFKEASSGFFNKIILKN